MPRARYFSALEYRSVTRLYRFLRIKQHPGNRRPHCRVSWAFVMRLACPTASNTFRLHIGAAGKCAKSRSAMLDQFAPHPVVVGWLHLIIKRLLHALIPPPPSLPSSFRETFVWTMSRDITFALYHSWYSTDARLAYSRIRILSSCTFVRRNFLGRMRVFVATADR